MSDKSRFRSEGVQSDIDSLVNTKSFKNGSSVQISAKTKATVQIDCTLSGYKQLGIIGLYIDAADPEVVPLWHEFTSGSMLGVAFANLSSNTKTIAKDQVQVKILYVKN